MKKAVQRVATVIVAVAMCMTLCVPVFASTEKKVVPLDPENIVEFSDILVDMPPIILGTPDMAEYDNSPNIQSRASGLLFSMKATGVKELLITGASKTFVEADLPNDYLYISGDLEHTFGSTATIKVGGCYYDNVSGNYIADLYDYVYGPSFFTKIMTRLAISKEMTHRGFIKNQAGVGSISGDISFYNKDV